MAKTSVQKEVEDWIRQNNLKNKFKVLFYEKKMKLIWGGNFCFDAVSKNENIIVNISTSSLKTKSSKIGNGKIQKILKDTLYLMGIEKESKKYLLFTERCMFNHFEIMKKDGRFPSDINFLYEKLPNFLAAKLKKSKNIASNEFVNN